MTTEAQWLDLQSEVAALKARSEAKDTEPWHRKPATIISIAALAFSFGTTLFSAYNNHQEDVRANRRDVRTLLQRLSKLPIENYELMLKNKGTGAGEALSSMINQENILLATQAAELIGRFPDSFSSTEYFAVAVALANSNVVAKVPELYQRAMASATSSNDYQVAARAYGGFLYSKGDYTEGKRLYNEALSVWNRFPERNAYIVNSSDLLTLMYWSQSEYAAGNRGEARGHLDQARRRWQLLAPGPMTDSLKNQLDHTARFVD